MQIGKKYAMEYKRKRENRVGEVEDEREGKGEKRDEERKKKREKRREKKTDGGKKKVRWPGIEPGSNAWKASMLTITPPTLSCCCSG